MAFEPSSASLQLIVFLPIDAWRFCPPTPIHQPVLAERARQLAAALTGAGFKTQDKLGIYSGG